MAADALKAFGKKMIFSLLFLFIAIEVHSHG